MIDAVSDWLVPTAVLVSAASTTATAAFAWRLYTTAKVHDRALFGAEAVEGHDGLVPAVNENTQLIDQNRQILRRNDLLPGHPDGLYRGVEYTADDEDADNDGRYSGTDD
jgi:hypothetical protein